MSRPKDNPEALAAKVRSLTVMLSRVRAERSAALDAAEKVIESMEGCACGKKQEAGKHLEEGRKTGGICPACQEITCDEGCKGEAGQ